MTNNSGWTSHGWWYGPDPEPAEGRPTMRAKCGGPGMCKTCRAEAGEQPAEADDRKEFQVAVTVFVTDAAELEPASPVCGAQEGMTGIRCDLAPGHQDQHSGRHATTHGPDNVTVNIQWDRASWDTCAPANPVWVAGNREPGGDVVQAVQGRMTGRIYRRETEHFGGAWFWGPERGQWVVWERLLESERLAEAVNLPVVTDGVQR